jgi:phosphatidylglycerophosphate synthase
MMVTPGRECVRDATAAAVTGLTAAAVVTAVLSGVYIVSPTAVGIGVVLGSLPAGLAALGMLRRRPRRSTYADRVTLTRAVLASGCAAVAAMALVSPVPVCSWWFLSLVVTTLLLDAVDGKVARLTQTATRAGARLDMEVDAVFLVVLSVAVATEFGVWVLLIGAMRYLYLAASYLRPILSTPVPPSRFRRAVAGVQGIALLIALVPMVPAGAAKAGVQLALLLLLSSFGHQAVAVMRQGQAAHHVPSPVGSSRGDDERVES